MDKDSKAYRSGEFGEMFEAAKISNLAAEEVVRYRESERAYRDMELYRQSGYDDGRLEGMKEGMKEVARNMKKAGFSQAIIEQITGFKLDEL